MSKQKNIPNSVGARTQPCFTPLLTGNALDVAPLKHSVLWMLAWKELMIPKIWAGSLSSCPWLTGLLGSHTVILDRCEMLESADAPVYHAQDFSNYAEEGNAPVVVAVAPISFVFV